ncbi:hypothetical protein Nmel_009673 [Mimus melanotis]
MPRLPVQNKKSTPKESAHSWLVLSNRIEVHRFESSDNSTAEFMRSLLSVAGHIIREELYATWTITMTIPTTLSLYQLRGVESALKCS